jgi:hypothetical protein
MEHYNYKFAKYELGYGVAGVNANEYRILKIWSLYLTIFLLIVLHISPYSIAQVTQNRNPTPIDTIIVPESDPWMLCIATPLAARLKTDGHAPILLAVSMPPADAAISLLNRIGSRRCLALTSFPIRGLIPGLEKIPTKIIAVDQDPTRTGLRIARDFWQRSDRIVIASLDEPESLILGSTLATQLNVPFIPVDDYSSNSELVRSFSELGVKQIIAAIHDKRHKPAWLESLSFQVDLLDLPTLERQLVKHYKPAKVRNVILCRVPDNQYAIGISSWMAPYLSIWRNAPIVLVNSSDGWEAETRVYEFLKTHTVKPHTLTILSDHYSIGRIPLVAPGWLGDYELEIEPCSLSRDGKAAALGVGRIPCRTLTNTSLVIAGNRAREQLVTHKSARILMVANPSTRYEPLPLAETVSRLTAKEFKNLRMKVHEFYGGTSDDSEVLRAAAEANMIIYEGHVTDLKLFGGDSSPLYEYETYEDDASVQGEDLRDTRIGYAQVDYVETETQHIEVIKENIPHHDPDCDSAEPDETQEWNENLPEEASKEGIQHLEGFPLVVLQSCNSLDDSIAQQIFTSGGVGIIGTATNVHSASGSAFIKAFCDGMLYRNDAIGEALRDAHNYFLCLADLKDKRGHTQQAKVRRVALSFCLWGDPELKLFNPRKPKRKPISARFTSPNQIRITTPNKKLPTCRTDKYVARMFPGSQAAGIVKRLKDKSYRKLSPIYFFRLPLPDGFDETSGIKIEHEDDVVERTAYLTDPYRRYAYILYFPEKEQRREKYLFDFLNVYNN